MLCFSILNSEFFFFEIAGPLLNKKVDYKYRERKEGGDATKTKTKTKKGSKKHVA
jgi:hypothetical protein